MKSICQKSGVPIWKSDLLLGMDLADEHPIFRAKRQIILSQDMVHRFFQAENQLEKRLIYLAVLNTTYLVDFQVPASPSLHTMEATFGMLMPLCQWVTFAEYKLAKIVSFPQYVIRADNADLSNIKSWLQAIEEIRQKVLRKEIDRDKNAALLAHELEMKAELTNANYFSRAFTPKLAKWALEVCDIGFKHQDYQKWMKVLCMPLGESWVLNIEDLYEIQEILQIGLPNLEQNPSAISIMHQMTLLIAKCKEGFTQMSIFDNDPSTASFEIIEEDLSDLDHPTTKSTAINQHLKDVPIEKPVEKDYPSKIAFLVASAKWQLANHGKPK